jgi:hypothetical protein
MSGETRVRKRGAVISAMFDLLRSVLYDAKFRGFADILRFGSESRSLDVV